MSSDIQPKLRPDFSYTWAMAMAKALEQAPGQVLRTCLTCCAFDEPQEQCRKYRARPPARVIAYGCKDYFSEEELPF